MKNYTGCRLIKNSVLLAATMIVCVGMAVGQSYKVIILSPTAGFNETNGRGTAGMQRVGTGRIAGAPLPEDTYALLWLAGSTTPIDLHPAGWTYSRANDTDGVSQVGAVYLPIPNGESGQVAALWSGTPESFVPLCQYLICASGRSEALAIGGGQQVGYVDRSTMGGGGFTTVRDVRAALWRGTAQSYVDLKPTTFGSTDDSRALDTDGTYQVGWGYFFNGTHYRALMWSGTAASVVDLSPPNFDATFAHAVAKGVQVGYGMNYEGGSFGPTHALVWQGTAASVVDLGEGVLNDTNGKSHVGRIAAGPWNYYSHAARWDGVSPTPVDLHNLLPPGVYVNSIADSIDDAGNIVGFAQRADTYFLEAVVWQVDTSGRIRR